MNQRRLICMIYRLRVLQDAVDTLERYRIFPGKLSQGDTPEVKTELAKKQQQKQQQTTTNTKKNKKKRKFSCSFCFFIYTK